MVGKAFTRNQQHQQPYQDQTPDAAPAPTPRAVVFATPEAAHTVTAPLREKYDGAVTFANTEWQQAFRAQADIDGMLDQIEELKKKIDQRSLDKQQHLMHAQQACDVANPAAVLLGLAGVDVEQISPPIVVSAGAPPRLSVAEVKANPLDTSRPLAEVAGSRMDNPPAGHCIHCGKEVWRVEVSSTSPNGLIHGWGASCDPTSDSSTYADMGEDRVAAP